MNQKQRAKWECTRAKGMWRFVLLYGVVGWGGVAIIATSTLIYGWNKLSFVAPIYLVAGFVFGLLCWFIGEYKYRRSLAIPSQAETKHSSADAV